MRAKVCLENFVNNVLKEKKLRNRAFNTIILFMVRVDVRKKNKLNLGT